MMLYALESVPLQSARVLLGGNIRVLISEGSTELSRHQEMRELQGSRLTIAEADRE